MLRVLITDEVHAVLPATLMDYGYQCDYLPNISLDETISIIPQYAGIVINTKIKAYEPLLANAKQLKWIMRLGSGLEIIDLDLARSLGIEVINSPEGNRNAVGEHALGMLLCLANNIARANCQVKAKHWSREPNRGWELQGKTIAIYGFGQMGSAFAGKLAGMNMKVLAYDKYLPQGYAAAYPFVKEVDPGTLYEQADIISFHLPLTPETQFLVNTTFFQQCAKPIVIVNTARGKILDTQALIAALDTGKVTGACLDVLDNENLASWTKEEDNIYSLLFEKENVILTPHIAGWTVESKERIATVLLEKLKSKGLLAKH